MCNCRKINSDNTIFKGFSLGDRYPMDAWFPHKFLREESTNVFNNFFFQQANEYPYHLEIFIRDTNLEELLFFKSITEKANGLIAKNLIKKPYIVSEDLYCQHDNLYLTLDQFNDLLELIIITNLDGVLKYLLKIGFKYAEE